MQTTVIIRQLSGPQLAPALNYQVWQSAVRLTGEQEVTLPSPLPVPLDENGNGMVNVRAGVWFVEEVVPQGETARRGVLVPVSTVPVFYDELTEVTDVANYAFGPSYERKAMESAVTALLARDAAIAAADRAEIAARDTGATATSNSFLARDVDGVLYYDPNVATGDSVPLFRDTDGVLYYT